MTDQTVTEGPNIELLDAHIARIEGGKFLWDQSYWINPPWAMTMADLAKLTGDPPCGTAFCLAGDIAWQAGYRPIGSALSWQCDLWAHLGELETTVRHVRDIAGELLRVDSVSAEVLFCEDNTVEDLHMERDRLAQNGTLPLTLIAEMDDEEGESDYDDGDYYDD